MKAKELKDNNRFMYTYAWRWLKFLCWQTRLLLTKETLRTTFISVGAEMSK